MGGNAPLFSSTCQWKMSRVADLKKKNAHGVERKYGSRHELVCKRNKLGREGSSQSIQFDMYIKGGIDWWSPLVKMIGENYTDIISRSSATSNTWNIPDCKYVDDAGQEQTITTEDAMHERELGALIARSADAKNVIRKAFEIPEPPDQKVIAEVEQDMKKKRGKKKKSLDEQPAE